MTVPKIAESEWRVMKILWEKSPITANEIVGKLADYTRWNPKTIRTLLNRLVAKGAIGFEKDGRTYLYYPILPKSECARLERRSLLSKVYDGALKPMLAAFIQEEHLSREEIQELKNILEQKGKNI